MFDKPVSFTATTRSLLFVDVKLFFKLTFDIRNLSVLSTLVPIWSTRSDLDELAVTPGNVWCIIVHIFLLIVQSAFLIFLVVSPFCGIPALIHLAVFVGGIWLNKGFCDLALNGTNPTCLWAGGEWSSNAEDEHLRLVPKARSQEGERWVFINGISVGQHWLESNLKLLATIFRRPVLGIHNATYGILFDVLECVLQRSLGFPTQDVRLAYRTLSEIIADPAVRKVILIAHSQGGIEASMVLDWLYTTHPRPEVAKLEIYTFGNATNHWNCPIDGGKRIVQHVEHYANSREWVARFGVLFFRGLGDHVPLKRSESEFHRLWRRATDSNIDLLRNRFVGKLFLRDSYGHLLNQHYLGNMFQLTVKRDEVLESNPFMDGVIGQTNFDDGDGRQTKPGALIKSESRLWQYRNGGVP